MTNLTRPFANWSRAVRRLQVVEADQVHQDERTEEAEQDRRRARHPRSGEHRIRHEEAEREHVREGDGAAEAPVHLLEGAAEERGEEEEAREPAERHAIRCSRSASSCTRVRRESFVRHSSDELDRLERARRASGRAARSARARSRRCRRARRRRRRPSRGAARPRRRRAARPRGSGARRRGTRRPSPRARRGRGRPPPGSAAAAPRSRAAARASGGAVRTGSAPSGRAIPAAHSRSAERKSPTNRATTPSTRASAVRNGLGSRLPKNDPACVIRKRSPAGWYSSPAKSSKSEPLAIVTTGPARVTRAHLVRDRVGDRDDRVRLPT